MRGVTYQLDGGYLNQTGDLSYAGTANSANSGFGAGASVLNGYTPAAVGAAANGGYNGHGYNVHLGLGYVMPNNPQQAITMGVKFAGISGGHRRPGHTYHNKKPMGIGCNGRLSFLCAQLQPCLRWYLWACSQCCVNWCEPAKIIALVRILALCGINI